MGILDSLAAAVDTNKQKEQTGSGGWVGGLVAGILVIIVTAIFGFIAWKRGKEMAKLLHEKAVREEEAHQAQVDANLAENEEERQKALQAAEKARKDLEALELEREALREKHRETRKRIDAITSWDDVDSFLGDS